MPIPIAAKGVIIVTALLVTAGIALYESPQIRRFFETNRQKVLEKLYPDSYPDRREAEGEGEELLEKRSDGGEQSLKKEMDSYLLRSPASLESKETEAEQSRKCGQRDGKRDSGYTASCGDDFLQQDGESAGVYRISGSDPEQREGRGLRQRHVPSGRVEEEALLDYQAELYQLQKRTSLARADEMKSGPTRREPLANGQIAVVKLQEGAKAPASESHNTPSDEDSDDEKMPSNYQARLDWLRAHATSRLKKSGMNNHGRNPSDRQNSGQANATELEAQAAAQEWELQAPPSESEAFSELHYTPSAMSLNGDGPAAVETDGRANSERQAASLHRAVLTSNPRPQSIEEWALNASPSNPNLGDSAGASKAAKAGAAERSRPESRGDTESVVDLADDLSSATEDETPAKSKGRKQAKRRNLDVMSESSEKPGFITPADSWTEVGSQPSDDLR